MVSKAQAKSGDFLCCSEGFDKLSCQSLRGIGKFRLFPDIVERVRKAFGKRPYGVSKQEFCCSVQSEPCNDILKEGDGWSRSQGLRQP